MSDHFSQVSAHYFTSRPHYPKALFEWLAGLCPERQQAWDCGAGSGQASTDLALHFESVLASDISQAQLDLLPKNPKILTRCTSAADSHLLPNSVDLICIAQALHWFDLDAFYTEAKRVLKKEGLIAAWCYGTPIIGDEHINQLFQDFYQNGVGAYWPPERKHVENGYASLSFPFSQLCSPNFELREKWQLEQLLGYVQSWSATALFIQQEGYDPVDTLRNALAEEWQTEITIIWPLTLLAGRTAS
ncbi:class I SAM-dependent methyltransferase [Iodobacter fluviatilis]|uniref:Biotin biosynthesis protein BioC n=1 Tax=Iodobacter fluviatilis TaxID=537 RepID=A0A377QAT0_9NEIS|nr:class I SAM-dependent methyltransferase [Iodobacter fluviatilis]TCU83678.1 methyltransferase family protein [Iodobacter fluviatilis]STQ91815.1 biotin biosynthesis protein BioC [Iodobacter fluviatilis]